MVFSKFDKYMYFLNQKNILRKMINYVLEFKTEPSYSLWLPLFSIRIRIMDIRIQKLKLNCADLEHCPFAVP